MSFAATAEFCITKLCVEFLICGGRTFFRVVLGAASVIQYN